MSKAQNYTIGWICAGHIELAAAKAFLDEKHDQIMENALHDNNTYALGRIRSHNVVIAVMPHWQPGLVNATAVGKDMIRTFSNIRIVLMVGIGGGVPARHDIRLGDIVVSSAGYNTGGVLQYDYGHAIQEKSFKITGHLNQPPMVVQTAINALRAAHISEGHDIEGAIDAVLKQRPRLRKNFQRPDAASDWLYKATFTHDGDETVTCAEVCGNDAVNLVHRQQRSEDEDNPAIHYGLIASANSLMKDASIRDKLSREKDVLCFEMEAAGLMNQFPCLVIRGISDYSDTHKNSEWQGYAAMAAAAYACDLLSCLTTNQVEAEERIGEIISKGKLALEAGSKSFGREYKGLDLAKE